MSSAELRRIVDDATPEEQQFLFVCLMEKLYPNAPEEIEQLDARMAEMNAGRRRLTIEQFEKRLDEGDFEIEQLPRP